ncbi:CD4-2 molecule, tandem duplicate 2 isoform X2 [Electrophorus electricus]|uniref:CD4-2 molecule, tandem duplicate 2 isoform X2 n=1 Tax=Electrophorus electricus TaxID=8005 RepID=UPI0015CFAB6A|nr:CD4-2 molecule, tandem duplicate 2 isoform X2 [Electrophorus electricus]
MCAHKILNCTLMCWKKPEWQKMSTSEIYLCIILALCVPKGGAEMFYRKSGQDVVMNCGDAAQNSDLEWKHSDELILRINGKSGRMMKGASSVAGKAKITGTKLVINLLGTKDSGLYSCTGQNKIGTKNTWQHKLHVVSVIASPADVVLDSTEVTLTCDIPEDSTVEVQWMRPPDLKPFGYHGKTVTLKSVSLADAGHWVCQVKDEQGVELNIGLDITVVGPLMSTEEIVVIPGDTAELPCFLPNLSVLTIIGGGWVRHPPNGTDFLTLETQGKNLHWSDTNTMPRIMLFAQHLSTNFSVTLTNVQSADAGVYVCTLMFMGGKNLSAALNLKVEEDSRAVVPVTLEITAALGGTAELPCSHPGASHLHVIAGGWTHEPWHHLRFPILMSTESKGLHWNGTDVLASKVTFTDLQLNTNFNVTLHNVDSADAGIYVCTLLFEDGKHLHTKLNLTVDGENVRVAPDIRQTSNIKEFLQWPLLGVSLWVWAAAAGGFILLIGLVVVIVLIQKKRMKTRKNKRVRQNREKTKYSTASNTQELLPIEREFSTKKTERHPHSGRRERQTPVHRTQNYRNVM